MHNPVNHPLRPVYRALGALAGLYLVVFGVVGVVVTGADAPLAHDTERVLGQGGNLAASILSLVLGVLVLAGTVLGRNRDVTAYTYVGWAVLVIATLSLAVSRTEVNILNVTIATVIVSYLVGLALVLAGQYCKVAPPQQAGAPRQERQRQRA